LGAGSGPVHDRSEKGNLYCYPGEQAPGLRRLIEVYTLAATIEVFRVLLLGVAPIRTIPRWRRERYSLSKTFVKGIKAYAGKCVSVSDIIRQRVDQASVQGVRPCTIQLDHDGLRELILECDRNGNPITAGGGVFTFLGLPIEQGARGEVGMLYVRTSQRYIAWELRSRAKNVWDLFDLDQALLIGASFETREAASAHALNMELGQGPSGPAA